MRHSDGNAEVAAGYIPCCPVLSRSGQLETEGQIPAGAYPRRACPPLWSGWLCRGLDHPGAMLAIHSCLGVPPPKPLAAQSVRALGGSSQGGGQFSLAER